MTLKYLFPIVIYTLYSINITAQKLATFEVDFPATDNELNTPVKINLENITSVSESFLDLVSVIGGKRTSIPFQIENGKQRILHWIVYPINNTKKQVFELVKSDNSKDWEIIQTNTGNGILTIKFGEQNLLGYYFKTLYPPEGIDSAYKRSAFIHPLYSPHGQVLTRIQPPDHYHHYGIWNPWTHVLYEGDTIDFWNLAKRQGTVRFANFVSIVNGAIFSEYQALHEHVVFKENGQKKIAMNELQSVRVYQPEEDYYILDLTMNMNCADNSPVTLLEYRYAGLGWRATEQWDKYNSEVLSSTGKTRKNVDGSKERWCIIQGEVDDDYAGVVMMSHPNNYNFPEPMRIWPETDDNRGDVFASFTTTKDTDWVLKPRHNYVLNYRLIVFNGNFTKDKAESAWQYFATSPEIIVKIN